MLYKVAGIFLMFSLLFYAITVAVGDVFFYVLSFIILLAGTLFGILVLGANLLWRIFPENLKRNHGLTKKRFVPVVIFVISFFFILAGTVNRKYLDDSTVFLRFCSYIGILIYTSAAGWALIKKSRWRIILVQTGFLIVFFVVLSFANSLKSGTVGKVDSTQALGTIGYADWVSVDADGDSKQIKTGVVHHNPKLTYPGMNLYVSSGLPQAYLIDMDGNIVHTWTADIKDGDSWIHAELCENGDLLIVADDQMLIYLDRGSKVRWKKLLKAHHDVSVDINGNIFALGREDRLIFYKGIPVPILSDYIFVLSKAGTIQKKVHIYELMKEYIRLPNRRIAAIYAWFVKYDNIKRIFKRRANGNNICKNELCDITHLNSIEIMDRNVDGFCRPNDWLISMREQDIIALVDPVEMKVLWQWGPGQVSKQHHPTLLDNCNLLVFDNGSERGYSRIVEVDPLTKKIVWQYQQYPKEGFFSEKRGSCQRLPNGNTFIAESDKGRVFEITSEGEIVWDFYNPNIRADDRTRGAVYRMRRIDAMGNNFYKF
jgi:hypothetical protein